MERPHGHLHREGRKESKPQPEFHIGGEIMRQKLFDIGRSGAPVHRHDGQQHQHRAKQRVEEEFERGVDAPLAAPHTDDDEHRNEAAFKEDVEDDDIQRAEHADHQRFQHQKRDHVFFQTRRDGRARQNTRWHQESGQDDKQHRNAVHAHLVGDQAAKPFAFFHHLEAGVGVIKPTPDEQRDDERHDGGEECDVADVALGNVVIAADQKDQRDPDERQERDDGKDGPIDHWLDA
jgi:hypothetical protein